MFILPFLHYLKPYRFRLAIAVLCLLLVGAMSAVPVVWILETFDVMMTASPTKIDEKELQNENEVVRMAVERMMKKQTKHSRTAATDWAHKHVHWDRIAQNQTFQTTIGRLDRLNNWYQDRKAADPLSAMKVLVLILFVVYSVKGIATYLSGYELAYTFYKTNLEMREDLFNNIVSQDYLFFNVYTPGWLHSRINSDVKALQSILENMLSAGVQQPVQIATMFGMLCYLDWNMTKWVLVVVPIVGGILYYFARTLRKNTRKEKSKADQLSSNMTESLTNIRLVKAFGTEKIEIGKFHKRTQELFRYMMARRIAKFASGPIMEWLGACTLGCVALIGVFRIAHADLKLPMFIAYLYALSQLYKPLKGLATVVNKYQIARVSCERMLAMMAMNPTLREADAPLAFEKLKDVIEFDAIGFRYENKQILEGISLRVEAGRRVAFVGPSGAGKTTLVNMLARLFDPSQGHILIDGIDLRRLRIADWRSRLAIVTQENVLFDDTIANNVAYGSPTVDLERIEACARAANAHDFITELDGGKGYQTVVGPTGARLSGGQRQRLAIARALYRDPQILILDEATSSLDSHSQALVQEALARLMVGRTTFVIAHRISTIRDVDCIYVINDGRIIESGTHDELMGLHGYYSSLVIQSETEEPQIPSK